MVERLTADNIFKRISQEEIMSKYFPEVIMENKFYTNPFRADSNASCYFNYNNNVLRFNDLAWQPKKGNCFDVVMWANNLNSYHEALMLVNRDFNLGLGRDDFNLNEAPERKSVVRKVTSMPISFNVVSRYYNKTDQEYWTQFGISKNTLKHYNVKAVKQYSKVTIDNTHLCFDYDTSNRDLCYCYPFKEDNDDKLYLKIYRPLQKGIDKWRSNTKAFIVQGYTQLPKTGELLIITSSLKDVMCLYEYGYDSVAPQSETTLLPNDKLIKLKERFKRIIVIYNNDKTGLLANREQAAKYQCEYIDIPDNYPKDFSDIRKKIGHEEFINFLKQLIK